MKNIFLRHNEMIAENEEELKNRDKVKFVFTVQEECGLVGAGKMDDYFLWGTDAAFVVDRRGRIGWMGMHGWREQ